MALWQFSDTRLVLGGVWPLASCHSLKSLVSNFQRHFSDWERQAKGFHHLNRISRVRKRRKALWPEHVSLRAKKLWHSSIICREAMAAEQGANSSAEDPKDGRSEGGPVKRERVTPKCEKRHHGLVS